MSQFPPLDGMKPRLTFVNGTWKCYGYVMRGIGTALGFGVTPEIAYRNWWLGSL